MNSESYQSLPEHESVFWPDPIYEADSELLSVSLELSDRTIKTRKEKVKHGIARRILGGLLAGSAAIPLALVAGEVYDHRPAEPAHVNFIHGLPEANKETPPGYKENRVFLTVGGFGRPVACEMATKLFEATSEYGETACLVRDPRNIDTDEIVAALEAKLLPLADSVTGELELIVYEQSAGGKIGLPSIEEFLEKFPNVHLSMLILDSAPYDKEDVIGSVPSFLAKYPGVILGGMITMVPAQAYSLASDYPVSHSLLSMNTWHDAITIASGQRTSGLKAEIEAIDEPLPELSAIAASDPRLVYIRPSRPGVDSLVNTAQAYEGWTKEFEKNSNEDKYNMRLTGAVVDSDSHAALIRGGGDTDSYVKTITPIFEQSFGN